MTPEQKAKSMIFSFIQVPDEAMKRNSSAAWIDHKLAKKCALIAVKEIIEWEVSNFGEKTKGTEYWQQVKEAIKQTK